jgi:uncharacterized RDD family membrane protein YckC
MTEEKKIKTNSINKNDTTKTEWSFELDEKNSSLLHSSVPKQTKNQNKKTKKSLTLDETNYRPSKTRSELYEELQSKEKVLDNDVIQQAPIIRRALALIVDLVFASSLIFLSKKLISLTLFIFSIPMKRYGFQWIFKDQSLNNFIWSINIFIISFMFIVIPVSFYNISLGKKIFKLRIRGTKKFSLSLKQCLFREIFFKPISIFLIIGIILPFFNKDRKSLHDFACDTLVVDDE